MKLFSLHIHVFWFQILWNSTYCTHLFLNNHQTVLGPFWQTVCLQFYMKWNGILHSNVSSNLNLLFVWLSASFVWWINLSVADALQDQDLQTAIDISLLVKSQTQKLKAIRIKVRALKTPLFTPLLTQNLTQHYTAGRSPWFSGCVFHCQVLVGT